MKLLLSTKPEYSEKIFSGEKKYEFRKQKPRLAIDRIFIYECSPSKTIVGWFSVRRIHSGSPEEIWQRCRDFGGIKKDTYLTYCNGRKVIHAFEIDEVFKFDVPVDPFRILSSFKPPQSFAYLDGSIILSTLENDWGLVAECTSK